jgi:hypothetical protein
MDTKKNQNRFTLYKIYRARAFQASTALRGGTDFVLGRFGGN